MEPDEMQRQLDYRAELLLKSHHLITRALPRLDDAEDAKAHLKAIDMHLNPTAYTLDGVGRVEDSTDGVN